VARFENDRRSAAGFVRFLPPRCADAPAVSRLESRKVVCRVGCGKVVAPRSGKVKELSCHLGAHSVASTVVRIGAAVAIAKVPSTWRKAARLKGATEDATGGVICRAHGHYTSIFSNSLRRQSGIGVIGYRSIVGYTDVVAAFVEASSLEMFLSRHGKQLNPGAPSLRNVDP
jgi:hypothetical protein